MEIPVIDPDTLTLISTYKCTAACVDCCFKCSPKHNERLSLSQMKKYVNQCVTVYPSIRLVAITGGECFTLGDDLYAIIEYIHSKKLLSRIVTNASWATSQERAQQVVTRLIRSGLTEINFSTGDAHQKFVPIDNIINAIEACLINNIRVAVNVETHNKHVFHAYDLKEHPRIKPYASSGMLSIIPGLWISSDEDKLNPICEQLLYGRLKRCKELFHNISISPNAELFACCGLTTQHNPHFTIGSLEDIDIHTLWEVQFRDFLKIWLYTEGPTKIIDFARTINPNIKISMRSMHICEACTAIFSNPEILEILQKHYGKVKSRVMLEFAIRNVCNYKNKDK